MDRRAMKDVVDGITYDTEQATMLAHDKEMDGRSVFLYKTQDNKYFVVFQTIWQNERDLLLPLDMDAAVCYFKVMTERQVFFNEAFPGMEW